MLGLLLRSPHRRATSSGSVSLNSPFEPSHAIQDELDESESSSSRNCQSWTCPPPTAPEPPAPAVDPMSEQVRCRRLNLSASRKWNTHAPKPVLESWSRVVRTAKERNDRRPLSPVHSSSRPSTDVRFFIAFLSIIIHVNISSHPRESQQNHGNSKMANKYKPTCVLTFYLAIF